MQRKLDTYKMVDLLSRSAAIAVGIVVFLAALSEIASYLEQSATPPRVVQMLSSIISLDLLNLVCRLLLLLGVAVSLWQLEALKKRVGGGERLQKRGDTLGSAAIAVPSLPLKPNQMIHPAARNGVLWEWNTKFGVAGPFCPKHGARLLYKDFLRRTQPELNEEFFLGGNGSFVCSVDEEEEFAFLGPTMRVRELRAQVLARFQAQRNGAQLTEE
jgi:hypothetical protein